MLPHHILQISYRHDAGMGLLHSVSKVMPPVFSDHRQLAKHLTGADNGFGDLLALIAVGADFYPAFGDEKHAVGVFIRQINVAAFLKYFLFMGIQVSPLNFARA